MASNTAIEWTDRTWNPVTGCTKISPGCDHCYMFRDYPRLRGMGSRGYETNPEDVVLHEYRLLEPFHWRKPQKVFVCSMSDLFHPAVPFDFIHRVFVTMAANAHLTFQLLTKRPKTMAHFARTYHPPLWGDRGTTWQNHWPDNVWAGTSMEGPDYRWRLDALARVAAKVRFVSCEPLLAGVDLAPWMGCQECHDNPDRDIVCGCGHIMDPTHGQDSRDLNWVIVGGESGPGARPMHPQYARDIRDQCQAAGVPFFFKQWGEWAPDGSASHFIGMTEGEVGTVTVEFPRSSKSEQTAHAWTDVNIAENLKRVTKKAAGALLDGREWKEFPAA